MSWKAAIASSACVKLGLEDEIKMYNEIFYDAHFERVRGTVVTFTYVRKIAFQAIKDGKLELLDWALANGWDRNAPVLLLSTRRR